MKFYSISIGFGLIIGVLMTSWWILAIITRSIPEFEDEPFGISTHIAAEIITAFTLILSSVLMIKKKPMAMGMFRVSLGMLVYTSIASSGYFMDRSEIIPIIMFSTILVISLILMILSLRKEPSQYIHSIQT